MSETLREKIADIIQEYARYMMSPNATTLDAADRILQAIRKPNKAMVNAALHWQSHCSDVDSLFEQMIDAAIYGERLPPHPNLNLYSFDKPLGHSITVHRD